MFENDIGLNCSSPALHKHKCYRNTKGTNHAQLNMCRFCPCCVKLVTSINFTKFCRLYVCWILDHSTPGSTSFLKCVIILFSECSIVVCFGAKVSLLAHFGFHSLLQGCQAQHFETNFICCLNREVNFLAKIQKSQLAQNFTHSLLHILILTS